MMAVGTSPIDVPVYIKAGTRYLFRHMQQHAVQIHIEQPGYTMYIEENEVKRKRTFIQVFVCIQAHAAGKALGSYDPAQPDGSAETMLQLSKQNPRHNKAYNIHSSTVIKIMPPRGLCGPDAAFDKPIGSTDGVVPFRDLMSHPIVGEYFYKMFCRLKKISPVDGILMV